MFCGGCGCKRQGVLKGPPKVLRASGDFAVPETTEDSAVLEQMEDCCHWRNHTMTGLGKHLNIRTSLPPHPRKPSRPCRHS
eukprot:1150725-Pelagomonas_calceolata.AAC.4